jgi:hypothetical protein
MKRTALKSASHKGYPIKFYVEDSWGQLFILRNSMGIQGIAQANSWEDAYSVCEDELFDRVSPEEIAEWEKEYSTIYTSGRELWLKENGDDFEKWKSLPEEEKEKAYRQGKDIPFDSANGGFMEHPCWHEAYGVSGNNGYYAKDLNGESLDLLTDKLIKELDLVLEFEPEDPE